MIQQFHFWVFYLKKKKAPSWKVLCTPMFVATLFTIVEIFIKKSKHIFISLCHFNGNFKGILLLNLHCFSFMKFKNKIFCIAFLYAVFIFRSHVFWLCFFCKSFSFFLFFLFPSRNFSWYFLSKYFNLIQLTNFSSVWIYSALQLTHWVMFFNYYAFMSSFSSWFFFIEPYSSSKLPLSFFIPLRIFTMASLNYCLDWSINSVAWLCVVELLHFLQNFNSSDV